MDIKSLEDRKFESLIKVKIEYCIEMKTMYAYETRGLVNKG